MRHISLLMFFLTYAIGINSQTMNNVVATNYKTESLAQNDEVEMLKQVNLGSFGVEGANYSGIAWMGGDEYAVVSDKERMDGFYVFHIDLDLDDGKLKNVERKEMRGEEVPNTDAVGMTTRDAEGVAFNREKGLIYISGEGDQRIVEYDSNGVRTGREVNVPEDFTNASIYPNYGFEALTYSDKDKMLWTVTEHTLKKDGARSDVNNRVGCKLRLLGIDEELNVVRQMVYVTDAPTAKKVGRNYAFGVPELCALSDGSLLVLEREFYVAKRYLGSFVRCKIYRVQPNETVGKDVPLSKTLLADFTTKLNVFSRSIANYEGMCLGPVMNDGRQSLLLISDSQNNYGNSFFHLKDYLKVLLISN